MPRAKRGTKAHHRRKKIMKLAKGNVGGRRKLYRQARETVERGLVYAYRDRKVKKREFRALWIVRINPAVRAFDPSYSRFIEGTRESNLGSMWNPGYFNYGIAIHGALNVPLHPASHGCIRVPLDVGEAFHEFANPGDMVLVWDGVEEPEHYGAQPPIFNRLDPEWAATTTTLART